MVCSSSISIIWVCTYAVIPQKPHFPQQTFRGHFWPGIAAFLPHSALALQFDQHTSLGEIPDVPQALFWGKVNISRIPERKQKQQQKAQEDK
jgi:hypothetical protein